MNASNIPALPPKNTVRWVASRKRDMILCIAQGMITLDKACADYGLSVSEIQEWSRQYTTRGLEGLKVTKLRG